MAEDWTVQSLLEWTARHFRKKGLAEPRLEAELLLAHVLGQDRVGLYVNYHQPVNRLEREAYRELIGRRLKGEPLAYLTGEKEFFSLGFKVTPEVLIPRPDTEILVEEAIRRGAAMDGPLLVADVGTGSGAIAVTLAVHLAGARVYAIDRSAAALRVARENALRHGVFDRLTFLTGDLLEPLLASKYRLNLIVANLPYIPTPNLEQLAPEVRDFEPRMALDGGEEGLGQICRLVPQAYQCLGPGGYLLLEIAPEQAGRVVEMMSDFSDVVIIPDLAGRDRVVAGKKERN